MRPGAHAAAILLAGACLAALPGCGGDENTNEPTPQAQDQPVVRQYEVRARVTQVSAEGNGRLIAHHEAIPNFDGGDKAGMGMNVMTMPFWPPAIGSPDAIDRSRIPDALDLSGIEPGDTVTIRFEVQHASEGAAPAGYYAIGIEPLPRDTELDFDTQLPKVHTFKTRGEITQLPGPLGAPLRIRHEAVPDFPNPDGTMGMNTMTMQFWPPATSADYTVHRERIPQDLDLEGLEVGDKVLVTWEYQQDRATSGVVAYYAVELEKLPDDARLDYTPLP